jgi:hypothetical protein
VKEESGSMTAAAMLSQAAMVSKLISLLSNKLDMSSALVVPEQDQAIMIDHYSVNAYSM